MRGKFITGGVFCAFFLLWQFGAMSLAKPYLLPTPIMVLETLWERRHELLLLHLPATMWVVWISFTISVLGGIFLAILMDRFQLFREVTYPIVVISQTIPLTAIAPLCILWLGYGYSSKVFVTVLMTFFAVTITVFDGLQGTKREQLELLQTMGASRFTQFRLVKFPSALPSIFSALKMSIPISVIGATIAEWLGAQRGLGYFSRRMMTRLDGPAVFAPIVLLAGIAIIFVALTKVIERRFVSTRKEL